MEYDEFEDEIYHYGVKGMKWGVRRTPSQLGHETSKGKRSTVKKPTVKRKTTSKNLSSKRFTVKRATEKRRPVKKSTDKKKDEPSIVSKLNAKRKERKANKEQAKKLEVEQTAPKKKKKISEMSDEELNKAIRRLEMEKRYNELSRTPKKVSRGKKLAMDILESSGKNIGTQLATYAMGESVNRIAKSMGYGNIVNPKKGQKDK